MTDAPYGYEYDPHEHGDKLVPSPSPHPSGCACLFCQGERIGRAAEREACAKLAETSRFGDDGPDLLTRPEAVERSVTLCNLIAAAIRARGEGERTP